MRWLLLLSLLVSCGYRADHLREQRCGKTICVPYVSQDRTGELTNAIIEEIASSTSLIYVSDRADLVLTLRIVDCGRENIGYRFDKDKKGDSTRRIVADQGRTSMKVVLSLMDRTGVCLGPSICIEAHIDYDFDPLSQDNQLATFSLGQFANIDQAEEVASRSLYRRIALKVVDYLSIYC